MYGSDLNWLKDGEFIGIETKPFERALDYGLYNQRGIHWPPPSGYSNEGKT